MGWLGDRVTPCFYYIIFALFFLWGHIGESHNLTFISKYDLLAFEIGMGIIQCTSEIRMAEIILQGSQGNPAFDRVRGKRMAGSLIKSNINVLSGLLPGTPQCIFIIGFPSNLPWHLGHRSFVLIAPFMQKVVSVSMWPVNIIKLEKGVLC
jgi:hypothetical protein